jgi:hypothetical protein
LTLGLIFPGYFLGADLVRRCKVEEEFGVPISQPGSAGWKEWRVSTRQHCHLD